MQSSNVEANLECCVVYFHIPRQLKVYLSGHVKVAYKFYYESEIFEKDEMKW